MVQNRLSTEKPSLDSFASSDSLLQYLEQTYNAIQKKDASFANCVLIQESSHSTHLHALASAYSDIVEKQDGQLLEVDCRQFGLVSFWSLRPLFQQLIPLVMKEVPQLVQYYSPEIHAFDPTLLAPYNIQPDFVLAFIALTPSERRSHRESEQAFRMISGLCRFILEAQQQCPSLREKPLAIWWHGLQHADRLTLLTFRYLSRWISQIHAPIMLVASWDSASHYATHINPPVIAEYEPYVDWRREHNDVFSMVLQQCSGLKVKLIDEREFPGVEAEPTLSSYVINDTDQTREDHFASLALQGFQTGDIEAGVAYALQCMRLALLLVNTEEVLFFGRLIIFSLSHQEERTFDIERFMALWTRLSKNDLYAALEFSLAQLRSIQDVLVATWKAVAIVQSFLEHHQLSLECYHIALSFANTPSMRAQLLMYKALIAGKRLHRFEEAQEYIQTGFQMIEHLSEPEAILERGWLLNVNALMQYQKGHFRDGMTMEHKALSQVKQLHISEATHLKINLISNISVLYESTGRIEQAISTWVFFQPFLTTANGVFAKHYLFREGGLRAKVGEYEGALQCFRTSSDESEKMRDLFHGEICARACGYLSYQLERFEEAAQWYARSVEIYWRLGDIEHVSGSLLAQALCIYRMGQREHAQVILQDIVSNGSDDTCKRILIHITDDHRGQDRQEESTIVADWTEKAIILPSTKLNRPFYLVNLYV